MIVETLPGCTAPAFDPESVRDYADIWAEARRSLELRQQEYPALVERGTLTAQAAQADIAAWTAIEQEWRWICSGEGQPPHRLTLFDRIEAVDLALERIALRLSRAPRDAALIRRQDLLQAMRWHLSRLNYGDPVIHVLTWANQALRARHLICGTCERRREDPATHSCTRTDCGLIRTATERNAA